MRLLSLLARAREPGARTKRWAVEYAVPFNRSLGIRIVEVAPDSSRVVLRLPLRRRNRNVAGTVHGGAILALAETVHGVAVLWQFPPGRHVMFTRRAALEFLAPARGELRVEFSLEPEMRDRIESDLVATGRSELDLRCEVTATDGAPIAALEATYVLKRREEAAAGDSSG